MRDSIAIYKGALKQGEEKGMEKGIRQARIENAINFKKAGVPVETIAQCTGLTVQEVEEL